MALTTTLASPPAPSGFALFNNAPAANLSFSSPLDGGQSVCSAFWGDFGQSSADCLRAVAKLPTGDSEVAYTVHTGIGPHHLPQSSRAGRYARAPSGMHY